MSVFFKKFGRVALVGASFCAYTAHAQGVQSQDLFQRFCHFREKFGVSMTPFSHKPVCTLVMIHHANSVYTDPNQLEKTLQGHTDVPLSTEGVLEAEELAKQIIRYSPRVIYSSDLKRAAQTAHIIAEAVFKAREVKVSVVLSSALRGENHGDFEGMKESVLKKQPHYLEYKKLSLLERFFTAFGVGEKAESKEQVLKRTLNYLHQKASKHLGEEIVVVTHGAQFKGLNLLFSKNLEEISKSDGTAHADFIVIQGDGKEIGPIQGDQQNKEIEETYKEDSVSTM